MLQAGMQQDGGKRMPQVANSLDDQARHLDELLDVIDRLEDRLSPVLVPQPPTQAPGIQAGEALVPLAGKLRLHTQGIASGIQKVRNILDRLEL